MRVDRDKEMQCERPDQLNYTGKSDSDEENSSESVAYLQEEIHDPRTAIVQNQITGDEAKMLVILDGEQRLITFEIPKEDCMQCTVQDLLEQANIFCIQEPRVSLVSDPTYGINYIVDVTATKSANYEEGKVESMSNETTTAINTVEPKALVKSEPDIAQSTASTWERMSTDYSSATRRRKLPKQKRTPKYIKGMLAVCSFCGMRATDFNYCMRCKRKLPENVKSISIFSGILPKDNSIPEDIFYETSKAALSHKTKRDAVAKRDRTEAEKAKKTEVKREVEVEGKGKFK